MTRDFVLPIRSLTKVPTDGAKASSARLSPNPAERGDGVVELEYYELHPTHCTIGVFYNSNTHYKYYRVLQSRPPFAPNILHLLQADPLVVTRPPMC
jgi:hypothetical protein